LIPVRVFDGENLIGETRLANAIIYATDHADVISCSWGGLPYPAVENAIEDTVLGRDGRGSVFIASSGNEMKLTVAFPARHSPAIAVGACGPNNQLPPYANRGNELAVVAPSSFNNTKVYSTDVSQSGWGYNPGDPLDPVDPAGQFTNTFGGTSAAAAMAAGVAALCLSINPNLTAAEVRSILEETADPIPGGSQKFGHGRINAAAAYNEAEERLGAPS
jgi:subtilisin family serine protease